MEGNPAVKQAAVDVLDMCISIWSDNESWVGANYLREYWSYKRPMCYWSNVYPLRRYHITIRFYFMSRLLLINYWKQTIQNLFTLNFIFSKHDSSSNETGTVGIQIVIYLKYKCATKMTVEDGGFDIEGTLRRPN